MTFSLSVINSGSLCIHVNSLNAGALSASEVNNLARQLREICDVNLIDRAADTRTIRNLTIWNVTIYCTPVALASSMVWRGYTLV